MDDVFARIGLALRNLNATSSSNDRHSVDQLAEELQSYEGSINQIVNDRVTQRLDEIEGSFASDIQLLKDQVAAINAGLGTIADAVDPAPVAAEAPAETPAEGLPSGLDTTPVSPADAPVAPEALPNKAAVAEAIVAEGGEPPAPDASRADLEATLHEVRGTTPDGAESTVAPEAADTLVAGDGADSVAG